MRNCRRFTWALILVWLCAASALARDSRPEFELFWDDGEPNGVVAPSANTAVAAAFETPSPTASLVAVKIFVADDGITHPVHPSIPTTAPFVLHVWRPLAPGFHEPGIGSSGYVPFPDWYMYPEDTWLTIYFPTPFEIGDPAVYWDGVFFVGIKWWHDANPHIGLDLDEPDHDAYWVNPGSGWSPFDGGDVLLRAVVRDTTGSAVLDASWSSIKAGWR